MDRCRWKGVNYTSKRRFMAYLAATNTAKYDKAAFLEQTRIIYAAPPSSPHELMCDIYGVCISYQARRMPCKFPQFGDKIIDTVDELPTY